MPWFGKRFILDYFEKLLLDKFLGMGRIFFVTGAMSYFQSVSPPGLKKNGAIFLDHSIQLWKVINLKEKGGKFEVFRFQTKRRCSFNPNPELRRKDE
jgi:hypothetical protein